MLPAPVSGDPSKRTAADNQIVRVVFVIVPDKVNLILVYPMTHRPQLRRGAARHRLAAAHGQA
jgi:hypothetical protein